MRITICDDNPVELTNLKKWIENYSQTHPNDISNILCFNSSMQMWFEIQENDIADIYILDIDMPKMNGFELAGKIRETHSPSIIIFLTSHTELAYKGYQYQAFRYVRKINMEEELTEALDSCIKSLQQNRKVIALKHYSGYRQLLYEEIMYVHSSGRQLKIYTKSLGIITENSGLSEFFKRLNDVRFEYIDRSCFLNVDYIAGIEKNEITLTNGQTLSASRRQLPAIRTAISRAWGI